MYNLCDEIPSLEYRKNDWLKLQRKVSFEDVVLAIQSNALLDIVDHPNAAAYPNQKIYIIDLNGYVHLVPFVEDSESVFLKTIIPSCKATAQYLRSAQP